MALLGLALLLVGARPIDDGQVQPGPTSDAIVSADTLAAAAEAQVDLVDLLGAMATTQVSARRYLIGVGELVPPVPPPPPRDRVDDLIDCLEWAESRGVASAVNPRSGASGPLQFLPSTWRQTPQGRAGLSVFDRSAAHAATRWMIAQGRLKEWSTWRQCA